MSDPARIPRLIKATSEPASAFSKPNRTISGGNTEPSVVSVTPKSSIPRQAAANTARWSFTVSALPCRLPRQLAAAVQARLGPQLAGSHRDLAEAHRLRPSPRLGHDPVQLARGRSEESAA